MPVPVNLFMNKFRKLGFIDYNGHLNMAYYNVMMDRAIDQMWLQLGIGPAYMKERHGSTFTAECHVRYLREIHLGDPVQVSILLVAADESEVFASYLPYRTWDPRPVAGSKSSASK